MHALRSRLGNNYFFFDFIPTTFRKLGRLALGLKKSDIKKLDLDSIVDFVAEFSQTSNWTLGQVCNCRIAFL